MHLSVALIQTTSQGFSISIECIFQLGDNAPHNNNNKADNMKITAQTSLIQIALLIVSCALAGNSAAQSWTTQEDMKVARVEATTIDYRDDIYVFNGFKPGIKIANSVEKFSAATKKWNTIASSSTLNGTAVTHNGAVRVGAEVWIIGGRVGSHPGRVSDRVWVFNLNTHKWRRGPDLPMPSAAGGAALVNNRIHWIGGIDANASCDVNSHFVYDLGKPAAGWKDITASAGMPTPRNHFSTAVVNNIIYIMGGQFGHDACPGKRTNDSALVHAFNPGNNKWTAKASMPGVNSHSEPGTFVYKGDIYTTGGENFGKDKVLKYNPRANKWSTFKTLPEGLVAPIARIIDGRLIVAGGGAPRAEKATDTVRSILVDNNPPPSQQEPEIPVVVEPEPEPEPEPVPGSHKPQGDTLISMEAEYFDIETKTSTHQWIHVVSADSSNDDAMITTPDQGDLADSIEQTPMLSYLVNFNHSGKHYIWVRGKGDSNAAGVGNSDSLHVGLNGAIQSDAYRIDQFPDTWTWSRHTPTNNVASINVVNAGINMVNFWMREDGLAIDKFVITSDPDFVPAGHGPALSDGTDDYVAPVAVVDDATGSDVSEGEQDNNQQSDEQNRDSEVPSEDVPTEGAQSDEESSEQALIVDDEMDGASMDESVADEGQPIELTGGSGKGGVFGGSTSVSTVLALLIAGFFRIRRSALIRTTTSFSVQ